MKWYWANSPPCRTDSQIVCAVAQPVGHGNLDLDPVDRNAGDFHSFHRAQALEFQFLEWFAGGHFVGRAQGGLHHAASPAEDRHSPGVLAQEQVRVFLGHGGQVDFSHLQQFGRFAGGEHRIDIRETILFSHSPLLPPITESGIHLLAGRLDLLGRAGHDRDDVHPPRVDAQLLGGVGLGHRAEHLLWGLGRGEVGDQIGIEYLAVANPAGRTGGELGKLAALLETVKQLVPFL